MEIIAIIATLIISAIVFIPLGVLIRKRIAESKVEGAEGEAKRILDLAKKEAETIKKEEVFKAKEEIIHAKEDLEKEIRQRTGDLNAKEARITKREENIERRTENFEQKEKELEKKAQDIENQKKNLEELEEKRMSELEKIAKLSEEDAKTMLLSEVEKQLKVEKANLLNEMDAQIKEEANQKAKEILTYTVQKCAADHTAETTVSIVALPNDDMKGRIIGREGRNIKALETLTGIDLIIDDTPEAVVISGFDPLRREVAKIALEKLIEDGRIHPAKIEETVEKAKEEVANTIK